MRILFFVFVDGSASTKMAARSPNVSITRDEGRCEQMACGVEIRNDTSVLNGLVRLIPRASAACSVYAPAF
jgi:hypothetical protein